MLLLYFYNCILIKLTFERPGTVLIFNQSNLDSTFTQKNMKKDQQKVILLALCENTIGPKHQGFMKSKSCTTKMAHFRYYYDVEITLNNKSNSVPHDIIVFHIIFPREIETWTQDRWAGSMFHKTILLIKYKILEGNNHLTISLAKLYN